MSSSFGFIMILAACLAALFSAVAIAAPTADIEKRSFLGKATYFAVGLGSCGQTNVDSDYIVALNPERYEGGSHCGKKVRITVSGKSATATVRDTCPGCGPGDLDMSPSLFKHFASLDKGIFQMKWNFI
ncbi:RlpA-like double-psi beta-barrel-protein domain-containing protein-containing protein [Lyophyllum atratum]|nr:RlpA-like double-psi beta-barrel-protein domain-containing protein-containing protein [Lyophyllum atratum]